MNPWSELPDAPPWVLPSDRSALVRRIAAEAIRDDLLPEPYVGDPGAPVVVLMKAPGVHPADSSVHREPDVIAAIRRSHLAEAGWFHPLEPELAGTPAERWWRASLADLIEAVGEATVASGLFVAQAFPYHVVGSHPVDLHPPPSFGFTVELVAGAVARGAQLVLVSGKAGWRRALGERTLATAIHVRSPLAGHLSRRNLGPGFDLVVDALATASIAASQSSARYVEGRVSMVLLERVERNRMARRACLEHWGTACSACGMSFEERYGLAHGQGIQVHHLQPLAQQRGAHEVDPVRDLRPVCPNCHVVLHTADPPLHPDALAAALRSGASPRP